jgi:hypothetical protein
LPQGAALTIILLLPQHLFCAFRALSFWRGLSRRSRSKPLRSPTSHSRRSLIKSVPICVNLRPKAEQNPPRYPKSTPISQVILQLYHVDNSLGAWQYRLSSVPAVANAPTKNTSTLSTVPEGQVYREEERRHHARGRNTSAERLPAESGDIVSEKESPAHLGLMNPRSGRRPAAPREARRTNWRCRR